MGEQNGVLISKIHRNRLAVVCSQPIQNGCCINLIQRALLEFQPYYYKYALHMDEEFVNLTIINFQCVLNTVEHGTHSVT